LTELRDIIKDIIQSSMDNTPFDINWCYIRIWKLSNFVDDKVEIFEENEDDNQAEDSYTSEKSELSMMAKKRTVEYWKSAKKRQHYISLVKHFR